MKKICFLLLIAFTATSFNALGFFYDDPQTLWGDASFGLYQDDWDLIMANPAELSSFRGMELYTKYDEYDDYERFEIAYRKYVSDKFGGISVYFTKDRYASGWFEDYSYVEFWDYTGDGIYDIRAPYYESEYEDYLQDTYSFFLDYGKEFSKDLKLGLGIAYYLSKYADTYQYIYEYTEQEISTGDVSWKEVYDEYDYEEEKRSELDIDLGSVYRMNDDFTLEGVLTINSVKNGDVLTDSYWIYDEYRGHTEETHENETYTGSDIEDLLWDSSYSGLGLNFDIGIFYKKLKDQLLILDIGFHTVGATVDDDEYVDEYSVQYVEKQGSDTWTDTYIEKYTTTRTGTLASYNALTLFLRYQRKFSDKVRFGAGLKYHPFATRKAEYTSTYQYYEQYDENDGDGLADDYHYTYEYSYIYDVMEKDQESSVSFPFTLEIRGSPVLLWRIGLEHTFYMTKWTEQWILDSFTSGHGHEWEDNAYDSWWEDDLDGYYDTSYKYSYSDVWQETNFRLAVSYSPVKNLCLEALARLNSVEFDDLFNTWLSVSLRYFF